MHATEQAAVAWFAPTSPDRKAAPAQDLFLHIPDGGGVNASATSVSDLRSQSAPVGI